MEKKDFYELSHADRTRLTEIYGNQLNQLHGYALHKILYVRELFNNEKGVLSVDDNSIHLSGTVLQLLYKVKGRVLPTKFIRAVNRAVETEDILRTNYVYVDNKIIAVVLKKREQSPEISFHNLQMVDRDELDAELRKNMEAALRHGFSLRRDNLLRLAVYHTGKDEYAVVVTALEAIINNFDVKQIFRASMDLPDSSEANPIAHTHKPSSISAPIRDYWSKMLNSLPTPPKIPYIQECRRKEAAYKEANYVAYLPRSVVSDLRSKVESNKLLLLSILQTAWGILLQQGNGSNDVSYCLMVPRRERGKYVSGTQCLVPVRLRDNKELTLREVIMGAFKQFVVSQPYASLAREDIAGVIGKHDELYDHFLNFSDYLAEDKSYVETEGSPGGTVVVQRTSDVRNVKLGIFFRHENNQEIISFKYNGALIAQNDIQLLVDYYFLILQRMLNDWEDKCQLFMARLEGQWQSRRTAVQPAVEDSWAVAQDGLSKLTLFQECGTGVIQLFRGITKIVTKFEGDRISDDEIEHQLIFVLRGKVARSIETGDGWYNTMDILKENSWVNEVSLLPNHKIHLSAEVLTEQATLMTIPVIQLNAILYKSPILANNIIMYTLRQLEKYQRLWIQS